MALNTELVTIAGKNIKVKELSMAAHLRMEELGEKRKSSDLYRECVDSSDWAELTKLGDDIPFSEYKALIDAIDRVNGYKK